MAHDFIRHELIQFVTGMDGGTVLMNDEGVHIGFPEFIIFCRCFFRDLLSGINENNADATTGLAGKYLLEVLRRLGELSACSSNDSV